MEIAKAFFRTGGPGMPEALERLLQCAPALTGFTATEARPEFLTTLPPPGSSGPRHHDVWIRGQAGERDVVVGIEAKADERFSQTLAEQVVGASERSDIPERLRILGAMVFGPEFDLGAPRFAQLGSQLLTGLAGTAIQAAHDGAQTAAFVIYEFSSVRTTSKLHERNADALNAFVRLLPGGYDGLAAGAIVGPVRIAVPGGEHPVDVFIAKVTEAV